MRDRDLQTLEFDKVVQLLSACALSSAGQEACLGLRPQTEMERVEAESHRAWQFFRLLAEFPAFPFQSFPDVRSSLQWAVHEGAVLTGQQLLEVLELLRLSRILASFFQRLPEGYEPLGDLLTRLSAFPELEDSLNRCLTSEGQLTDDASPELSMLRARRRSLTQEIEQRLQRLVRTPALREAIADHYVTLRNNRFVIPIRASRHGQVPGVVQDRSASGETLFVEPFFAVELNNRLLLTKKEEEAEEQRVLLQLTALVRSEHVQLESVFATLTEIDVLYATAALARKQQGTKPNFGGSEIRLRDARHPLLLGTRKTVAPIDLLIPAGKSGLLITGPNTGGKTVALKTVGLLCLMAQSGMLIPVAADNRLPIFRGIFADIGDPQSLEQNLSTFSAHLQNIVDIAHHLCAPALLVLDDPGGGTDPAEGGALACGLFTYFKACGALVIAATHLMSVKLFAMRDGTYQVAAVDFEVETLTPHYQLRYDSVGQSLGLAIARRLGIPEAACAAAEAALAPDTRQLTQVLTTLHDTQAALDRERAAATTERERLTALRHRQEALVNELEEKKQRVAEELSAAKHYVHTLRREGRAFKKSQRDHATSLLLAGANTRQECTQDSFQQKVIPASKDDAVLMAATDARSSSLQIGDEVEAQARHIRGELVALRGDRARIRQLGVIFDVPLTQIRKVS